MECTHWNHSLYHLSFRKQCKSSLHVRSGSFLEIQRHNRLNFHGTNIIIRRMKISAFLVIALALIVGLASSAPQRRRYGGRGRHHGGYYRPSYSSAQQSNPLSNYVNNVLPYKVVFGAGVGTALVANQLLNGK